LKIFFACFGILISSCSHTSKVSESSAVQALNGNNYQSPVSGAGGGLSLRDGYSITRISGELLYEGGAAMPEPLRYQKIVLMRDQKAIARVMTDAGGAFVIAAEIPNGVYVITLDSTLYKVHQLLRVDKYKIEGLRVFATLTVR
jgi:hypothetical protein